MDVIGFDLNLLKAFDALYAERYVTHGGAAPRPVPIGNGLTRLREVFKDKLFVRSKIGTFAYMSRQR